MTTEEDVERWIRRTLADAPPLTEQQRATIARLLASQPAEGEPRC